MSHVDTRLGTTPILQRLAYSFLCRGLGMYPTQHGEYDTVIVRELYPWTQNPNDADEYGGGIIVEFYSDAKRKRFVEFGVRRIGSGGAPAVRLLDD